ncbi:hypothetical protein CKM354_000272700 [Cercospora kikuchii]|uniref:Uncharacterized protein n=1 Tax=Cercospora kikuchii TaxID=84275 RepID=A0A9P3CG77_9PEZI|nr:uncharacterized protein CKM354_000272700 [Cercospora kikuchii]GIZ39340.1 hypothetical protein CKM354_000272700 [Cercospora kikuchii]
MAPRHLETCLQLAEELDAAYLRAKTNRLLEQYDGDIIPNHFHGYGCAEGAGLRGHVASVKNAKAEVRKHFDRTYLISVADVYGAGSKELDPSAPKMPATPRRKVKVNFNVKQHPDEGAKRIIKICIHRYHQTPPNAVQYAIEKTHTFFNIHPGADLGPLNRGPGQILP